MIHIFSDISSPHEIYSFQCNFLFEKFPFTPHFYWVSSYIHDSDQKSIFILENTQYVYDIEKIYMQDIWKPINIFSLDDSRGKFLYRRKMASKLENTSVCNPFNISLLETIVKILFLRVIKNQNAIFIGRKLFLWAFLNWKWSIRIFEGR